MAICKDKVNEIAMKLIHDFDTDAWDTDVSKGYLRANLGYISGIFDLAKKIKDAENDMVCIEGTKE